MARKFGHQKYPLMWQVYAIYFEVGRLKIILKDMLKFETITTWNLERLRNYIAESIRRINATGDTC